MSKWDVERAVMRDTRGKPERAWILAIPPLPSPARHIMHALLSRADADTAVVPAEFAPSLTELAALTGLDRSTVRRQLNHLEKAGWTIRNRPDAMDARLKGVTTWYELRIPGQGVGAECPHPEAQSPQVEAEVGEGRGTRPPIPSPDLSDPDQSLSVPVAVVRASGAVEPDEEREFIDWIETTHKPRGPGWWRHVAANGDLGDLAEQWRTERAQKPAAGPRHPPWCGECDETTRLTEDDDGRPKRCRCHALHGEPLARRT